MSERIGEIKITDLLSGDHLEHHGIKGQKWGVRRFQNYDGTLKKKKPESSTWKSKDASSLSDEELNRRNSRLQREQQYREMTRSKGQKFLKGLGKAAAAVLLTTLTTAASESMKKNIYKPMMDEAAKFIKRKTVSAAAAFIISRH